LSVSRSKIPGGLPGFRRIREGPSPASVLPRRGAASFGRCRGARLGTQFAAHPLALATGALPPKGRSRKSTGTMFAERSPLFAHSRRRTILRAPLSAARIAGAAEGRRARTGGTVPSTPFNFARAHQYVPGLRSGGDVVIEDEPRAPPLEPRALSEGRSSSLRCPIDSAAEVEGRRPRTHLHRTCGAPQVQVCGRGRCRPA
jgi:hypothetical protein